MENNIFLNRRKKYKFTGCFDSDKSEKEIDEILDELGFYMFKYDEINKPVANTLKKTNMGRPLKHNEELMKAIVNREKSDAEFSIELKKPQNSIRNMRSRWTRNYPHLLKQLEI